MTPADAPSASEGSRGSLSAADRHESITALLESAGRVEVTDLASRLGVSEETIRRDLRALENDGRLVRAHGGAVRPSSPTHSLPVPDEHDRAFLERVRTELPSEGTVYIDGDGSATHLIELLPHDIVITVVTPLLDLAIATSRRPEVEILSLGGEVSASGSLSGEWARRTLEELWIDTVVIVADGCTASGEVLAAPSEALLRRTAIAKGQRTVLALRGGAIDPQHYTVFAAVPDFDVVIATAGAATRVRELRDDAVIVAQASSPAPSQA